MNSSPEHYRLAMSFMRGMNLTVAREIIRLVGSEKEFFTASETRLRYITQSRSRIYSNDFRARALAMADAEEEFMARYGVRALHFSDPEYPARLLQCDDAPTVIYTIGELNLNECRTVGIVGTRHATHYGLDFTRRLIEELKERVNNVAIISGLAYGIDIAAHRAALRAGVPTVAVMATGLNSVYPADHRNDAQQMVAEGGLLVTEYGHNEPIHKGNFVARNRVVAGLCDCLVVAESADRGGALITANIAAGYHRDVMALPGRISDEYSAGCNRLIAGNLATLIRNAEDLCREMRWATDSSAAGQSPQLPIELNPDEATIVNFLERNDDASLPQLTAATGFSVSKLMSLLIDMEFRGLVMALPGGRYHKT